MRTAGFVYRPVLRASLAARPVVVSGAAAAFGLSVLLAMRLGTEFIPSLNEGDAAVQALRLPGTGLAQSLQMQIAVEKRLLEFPEVKEAFARIGTQKWRRIQCRPPLRMAM